MVPEASLSPFCATETMPLAPEDALRLNVLMASAPLAIRIDESSMAVHGLSAAGEWSLKLHPTTRDERYLKEVREFLSGHVMGSPGGYPVFLQRWTRMGQARDENLAQMLLLGEPEAVVAVVGAQGLTDELARRAWWAMPEAENARRMLANRAVVDGAMGPILARHLIEYLPFEEEPLNQLRSVRCALQGGLIGDDEKALLWNRAQKRPAQLIGFLQAMPDALPCATLARADHEIVARVREAHGKRENAAAVLLARVVSAPGQAYLETLHGVFQRPPNQEVAFELLDTVARYFSVFRPAQCKGEASVDEVLDEARRACVHTGGLSDDALRCLEILPALRKDIEAMLLLSRLGYPMVRRCIGDSTASGTLLRRRLDPVIAPVLEAIAVLRRPVSLEAGS